MDYWTIQINRKESEEPQKPQLMNNKMKKWSKSSLAQFCRTPAAAAATWKEDQLCMMVVTHHLHRWLETGRRRPHHSSSLCFSKENDWQVLQPRTTTTPLSFLYAFTKHVFLPSQCSHSWAVVVVLVVVVDSYTDSSPWGYLLTREQGIPLKNELALFVLLPLLISHFLLTWKQEFTLNSDMKNHQV